MTSDRIPSDVAGTRPTSPSAPLPPADAAYARSLELHRRIDALYPRVEDHGGFYFRGQMRADPVLRPPGYTPGPEVDPVVCALAIKAATTKQAIVTLCELGDGDNALALTRVLLENACLFEWLLRGEGRRRLEAYTMFSSVLYGRVVATIEQFRDRFAAAGAEPEVRLPDTYRRVIAKEVFGNTRSQRPTWEFDRETRKGVAVEVWQIFQEIADGKLSFEHKVLYGAIGSDVVHSGPYSLSRTMAALRLRPRPTFVLRSLPVAEGCTISLAMSNVAMMLVLDALNQYIGLGLGEELAALKADIKEDPESTEAERDR